MENIIDTHAMCTVVKRLQQQKKCLSITDFQIFLI